MRQTNRRRTLSWIAAALLALAAAAFLVLTADPTPTTMESRRLFGLWRLREGLGAAGLILAALFAASFGARRETFLSVLSVMLVTGLFFGVLEGAGRAGLVHWPDLLSPSGGEASGWSRSPNIHVSGETYQDIATRHGIAHDPMPFDYATDANGFRNPPDAAPPEIIILGDSIVLGAQVARDQTMDAVLARELRLPVMQAALLGLAIQEQHDMLKEVAPDLTGKTVVQVFFEGNDLRDSRRYHSRAPEAPASKKSSFLSAIWTLLARASDPTPPWHGADYCSIADQRTLFLWTRKSFDGLMDEVPRIADAITGFKAHVEGQGGRYLLAFVPTKYRVLHPHCSFPEDSTIAVAEDHLSNLPQQLADWSEALNIPYIDLTPALSAAAAAGDIPWLWGDTHWSAAGHAAAGRALANWPALNGNLR